MCPTVGGKDTCLGSDHVESDEGLKLVIQPVDALHPDEPPRKQGSPFLVIVAQMAKA